VPPRWISRRRLDLYAIRAETQKASTMAHIVSTNAGRFCWVDLAATDAERAKVFYKHLFGWTSREQPANGGSFTRMQLSGQDVGSLYQLSRDQLDRGVSSHWTPYIRVDDVSDAARRAATFDGNVIVRPFEVSGVARIALIQDSVGAHVGLWEPIKAQVHEVTDG
jgi:predicted enzyme related to lactoylglutathione lyase